MSPENYTDKVSVNMNTSTLSQIDLLVDNGYYSNRSDFINQAVRDALMRQQDTLRHIIRRQEQRAQKPDSWFLGVTGYTAQEIARMFDDGERTSVTGYGVLHIDAACDRDKLYAVVDSICVRGRVIAPADVKAHYHLK